MPAMSCRSPRATGSCTSESDRATGSTFGLHRSPARRQSARRTRRLSTFPAATRGWGHRGAADIGAARRPAGPRSAARAGLPPGHLRLGSQLWLKAPAGQGLPRARPSRPGALRHWERHPRRPAAPCPAPCLPPSRLACTCRRAGPRHSCSMPPLPIPPPALRSCRACRACGQVPRMGRSRPAPVPGVSAD